MEKTIEKSMEKVCRVQNKNFFRDHAESLFELGYSVFPIAPGQKIPLVGKGESWQGETTREKITEWSLNGQGIGGIGIKNIPAIDCDILDKEISKVVLKAVQEIIPDGKFCFRVGQSPKTLIPVGGGSEISKKERYTRWWPDGRKEEIELLPGGESHYWVAYGIHPCGAAYTWFGGVDPLSLSAGELHDVDELDISQIIDAFNAICDEKGLLEEDPGGGEEKTSGYDCKHGNVNTDGSVDIFSGLKLPLGVDIVEIRKYLEGLPDEYCDNRDKWVMVGMAIHHETGGSDAGYEIYDTWSRKSSKYGGDKDTRGRWDSFKDKTGPDAITFRAVIKASKYMGAEAKEKIKDQTGKIEDLHAMIAEAADSERLREVMVEARKDKGLDKLAVSELAGLIRDKAKRLGVAWGLSDIKKEIRPKKGNSEPSPPPWIRDWVYLANQDAFGRFGSDIAYSRSSFRGIYGREMEDLSKGSEDPPGAADLFALNKMRIPVVHDHMYFPGAIDRTFEFKGQKYANTYSKNSHGDRKKKDRWTDEDKSAVDTFESHIREMFTKENEAETVLDTLCHIAQKGAAQRLEWLLVLKGCEGDGKTVILNALVYCLGASNTDIVNAEEIVTSSFTEWAHGGLFKAIEELKVPNENRYAVYNKIKSFITNKTVSIHPKGRRGFTAINTTSYIATTNFFDCIPIEENSRRITIVESRWNSKEEVLADKGADYFDRLFDAVENYSDAISEFLMLRKISPSFTPHTAPQTPSRDEAMLSATSDEMACIRAIIEDGEHKDVNEKIIDTNALNTLLEMNYGITVEGRSMSKVLSSLGYRRVPWHINIGGKSRRFWLKGVKMQKDRKVMNVKIRDLLSTPF